jgi:hypothetical protein
MLRFRFLVATLLVLHGATSFAQQTAPADSVKRGDLLDRLQRNDEAQFDADITGVNTAFRDSVLAALDSLGIKQFRKESGKRAWNLRINFDLATRLWDYNRTEGLVAAGGTLIEPQGVDGPWIQLQGAYASGPEKFRYHGGLSFPILRDDHLTVQGHYEDRVVPF